jgi:hypothetical protein
MSIIIPCWSADLPTWQDDPSGARHGTIWLRIPRVELGIPVYHGDDPAGFHCGLRLVFRDDLAGPRFHRELLKDVFRLYPMARVPRDRR